MLIYIVHWLLRLLSGSDSVSLPSHISLTKVILIVMPNSKEEKRSAILPFAQKVESREYLMITTKD